MGRRGPRPTPTALKIAKGTDRGTDQRKATVGESVTLPEAPESLGEAGRNAWERYGTVAEANGLLEERFLSALEQLAAMHDKLDAASRDIESGGYTAITDKGYEYLRPMVNVAKQANDDIRKWLIEFGFTPASAANVKVIRDNRPTSVKRRERA